MKPSVNCLFISCTAFAAFALALPAHADDVIPGCPSCKGDLNGDGQVDGADLGILLGNWGTNDLCSDLDGSGNVDGADLGILLGFWGKVCPFTGVCSEADHDCCTTGGPGCTDQACCVLVCKSDPFCCEVAWDTLCVQGAEILCGIDCGGGVCPPSDHDCLTTGGPGCTDIACCEQVCAVDPFCCDVAWDGLCVNQANQICYGGGVCPPSDHDCFTTGGPGCTDLDCCETVCAFDSFCCQVAWDGLCVNGAFQACGQPECPFECSAGATPEGEPCGADTNGGCNSTPPIFGSISCGETICGNAWALGGTRDTDWYQITLNRPTEVTFSISNNLPMVIGIVDTGGVANCALATALFPFAVSPFCGSAEFTTCLNPGTYWFFAGPNGFDGFPCDGGANEYEITLTCVNLGVPCPSVCESADHDCLTTGGPGCTDIACCEDICSIDPFCCQVAWDGLCVSQANQFCYGGGICPPSDHDCFTTGGPGCTDVDCCETVCAFDSFCCQVAWDGLCVNGAFQACGQPECPFECSAGATPEGEPCGADTNGGCNSTPPIFGSISCGETICGNAWALGGTRDTDWYQITLNRPTEVTFSISNNLPMVIGIVDTGGVANCALATALFPFAVSPFCGSAEFTTCLNPGTYWFFAGPNGFDGFPCDGGANEYEITLTCVNLGAPCASVCELADHDCFTTGGPGCTDIDCCEDICSIDPFCCNVSWDGLCVNQAIQFCG